MKDIVIGSEFISTSVVSQSNTAVAVGSGEAPVFATPMMIALMENAAYLCIKPFLDEGETSVGTMMSASHESATPVGLTVSAKATVTTVNGRMISFEVEASDEKGLIGKGTHERCVLNSEKFLARANQKIG